MPHVALVPFSGFRVREEQMLALGMSLPGLKQRAAAIGQLPALGLLTLAGLTPPEWTCSYHEAVGAGEALAPSRGLWVLAFASLIVWVVILPTTQAEQRFRYTAERELREGRIAEALTFMSDREATDFPPH